MWHLQDRKFLRPTADLRLRLVGTPPPDAIPLAHACSDLLVLLAEDALAETAHAARSGGLGHSLEAADAAEFVLGVRGFHHRLATLAEEVLRIFSSFRGGGGGPSDDEGERRFERCAEALEREYGNAESRSYARCSATRIRCLRPAVRSDRAKLEALETLTPESFARTVSRMLDKMSVECLYHGNCDEKDAEDVAKFLENHFSAKGHGGISIPRRQEVIKVPQSVTDHIVTTASKEMTDPNTAVEMYFQVGLDNIYHRVIIDLLVDIMNSPMYDQIRTKEQFGYSVSVGKNWNRGVMGIIFQVVSSSKPAVEIHNRINRFILEFREILFHMKPEKIAEHLCGIAKIKLQMFNSMEEETQHLWQEILIRRYDWESSRKEACCLRAVTAEDAMQFYDRWLMGNEEDGHKKGDGRRCLVVKTVGSGEERPAIDSSAIDSHVDECVSKFHELAAYLTWKP
mmetsp:Transcript_28308/g.64761  ORF Transcript_28308/g.64761 Transcript_28308/m.64761 type:complete len:456 (-) Transcript_28308:286-1653(-)